MSIRFRKLSRRRRTLIFGFAGGLALAAGAGLALWDRHPRDAHDLLALSLPDTHGSQQPLRQWQGKVLVVNFWATWCGPCREEMPEFVRAQRDFGREGLQVVGIAIDQPDKVTSFAKELELNYPALIATYETMDLTKPLGDRLLGLPFTVILDRKGRVVHTQLGPMKPAQLRTIIRNLL
ncbi:MAG TPA: TlpA disulfide reductase family protein [Casimicrobiaceae bacterium]|nr:TlpA disulfide reductase family protein [Casimicrobiaceae bacterium]